MINKINRQIILVQYLKKEINNEEEEERNSNARNMLNTSKVFALPR